MRISVTKPGTDLPPDLKAAAGTAAGGEELQAFVDEVDSGITAATKRLRTGYERLDADRSAIAAALKGAVVKRVIESDPILKKQLQAAEAQFKADQKRATEAQALLAEAQKLATKELAALQKLLDS